MNVFSTLLPLSNENKSCMRVDESRKDSMIVKTRCSASGQIAVES